MLSVTQLGLKIGGVDKSGIARAILYLCQDAVIRTVVILAAGSGEDGIEYSCFFNAYQSVHFVSFFTPNPSIQPQRQHQQTHIRRHTQRRQNNHHIPTRAKLLPPQPLIPHLREKLLIPLLPPIRAHEQHSRPIHGEQRADAIEFRGEDLQDDQREGELRQGSAHVCAFEGALSGADFDQFGGG